MIVKNPNNRHRLFRLMERKPNGPGYRAVKSDALAAINTEYLEGRLSRERAREAVGLLKEQLEKAEEKPVSWLPENQAIAENYWKKKGSRRRIKEPQAAYDRIMWAVRQLGQKSLLAEPAEIEKHLRKHLTNNQQRRAIQVVNMLRKFKQLSDILLAPPKEHVAVDYLTPEEVRAVMGACPRPDWRLCIAAAFATGARFGELFTMKKENLRGRGTHIWIATQLKRKGVEAPTKNGKVGAAFVLPDWRADLADWLAVPVAEKRRIRLAEKVGPWFSRTTLVVLGRQLTFHELRHSYVNYMLRQGATLTEVAGWIRDRQSTVDDCYRSWVQDSSAMEGVVGRYG